MRILLLGQIYFCLLDLLIAVATSKLRFSFAVLFYLFTGTLSVKSVVFCVADLDLDSLVILGIGTKSRARILIKVKSRIWICIKV
jgi:hypothetical protein